MVEAARLRELLERVRKAEGPDRNIDADIFEALGHEVKRETRRISSICRTRHTLSWMHRKGGGKWHKIGYLTSSVDDVRELIEQELPTYSLEMHTDPSGHSAGLHLWPEGLSGDVEIAIPDEANITLGLALCAAFLSAKAALAEART